MRQLRRHLTFRTLPGLEDAIDTERLRFRAEPGAPPAGGDGGGTPPAGGDGGGTPPAPAATPPAPAATPPAPTPPAPPTPPAGGGNGGGVPDDFDPERAMATIKAQRASEEAAKAEAKTEREAREKLEREKLTDEEKEKADAERIKQENATLKAQAQGAELLGTLATRGDVADAGIVRDMLLQRGLQFGEDGKPVDLDTAVTKLLEEKPLLRKGEAPAPGGDGGGNGGGDGGGQGGSPAGGGTPPPAGNGAAGSGGQGPPPQLTADEVKAANDAGQSVEQYAALRDAARKSGGKVTIDDWTKSQPPAEKQE